MSKYFTKEEIKNVIVGYVSDDRYSQAVLLDGKWGSGKTFFVKNDLTTALLAVEKNDEDTSAKASGKEKQDNKRFQVFSISLYGISKVSDIQDKIYYEWLKQHSDKMIKKLGTVGEFLVQGINALGSGAVNLLERKLDIEQGLIRKITNKVLHNNIGTKKQIVLLFDDIERCRVDIIELMGFLNNLAENDAFKVILVANGKEIEQEESTLEKSLRYQVTLNEGLDSEELVKAAKNNINRDEETHISPMSDVYHRGLKHNNDDRFRYSKEELISVANYLFEDRTRFDRTKEKLIGLTVPFNIDFREVYVDVVNKYVIDKKANNCILINKELVISRFEKEGHRNIRTFINGCIAFERIIRVLENGEYSITEKYKDIYESETKQILLYCMYTAIKRQDTGRIHKWKSNVRYGYLSSGLLSQYDGIFGYKFIDEYWDTMNIDKDIVLNDIKSHINEQVIDTLSREDEEKHKKLALNKLSFWYSLEDDDVKKLVSQMEEELRKKQYLPQEFKEIIITMMKINNSNFGMNWNKQRVDNDAIYDATDKTQFYEDVDDSKNLDPCTVSDGTDIEKSALPVDEPKIHHEGYEDWSAYNIPSFVDYMVAYYENDVGSLADNLKKYPLTLGMLRVLSDDKNFACEYRKYIMPLLKIIEENDKKDLTTDEMGNSIDSKSWDDSFVAYCSNRKNEFMKQGRFASLFNIEILKNRLCESESVELFSLCDAFKEVYSFSNLYDVFSSDERTVKLLKEYVDTEINNSLNIKKSRTKAIALRRLQNDLNTYTDALSAREI